MNTSTTPKVQYAFASGSANTIRSDSITYPDGRVVALDYGSSDSVADILSRPAGIKSDASSVTEYQYLGLATPVIVDNVEPDVEYTLVGTAGGDDPDTGDIYRGLDRFGRVKDAYWYDYGASSDAARIQYGYDRASNRTYRDDIVATAQSKAFDELYTYDGLHRLQDMGRGTLNVLKTALTTETFAQCWTLDETGNWAGFRQDGTGSGWDLIQARTANEVNEITDIDNTVGASWVTPAYDPAGNMTTIPTANPPGWSDMSTDDWSGLSLDNWESLPVDGSPDTYTATYDAWNCLVDTTGVPQTHEFPVVHPVAARHSRLTSNQGPQTSPQRAHHFTHACHVLDSFSRNA